MYACTVNYTLNVQQGATAGTVSVGADYGSSGNCNEGPYTAPASTNTAIPYVTVFAGLPPGTYTFWIDAADTASATVISTGYVLCSPQR